MHRARCLTLSLALLPALAGRVVAQDGVLARHVEDRDQVTVIELVGGYDKLGADGSLNVEPRALVAQEFYRTHPDRYDFLVIFTNFEFLTPSPGGGDALAFHLAVQNQVGGIGLDVFDHTADFGSSGRLLGYIDMAALTRYVTDPLDPQFERVLGTLGHELMHQWGAYVEYLRPDGSRSDALLGTEAAHWSFLLDTDGSLLYCHEWRGHRD